MTTDLTVLGGGSWGTALALHLARAGGTIALWVHDPALAAVMKHDRVNTAYLPGHSLPAGIIVTSDIGEALSGSRHVILVVPSHHCREALMACLPYLTSGMSFCSASKGIENDTLLRMSELLDATLGARVGERIAVLSGP